MSSGWTGDGPPAAPASRTDPDGYQAGVQSQRVEVHTYEGDLVGLFPNSAIQSYSMPGSRRVQVWPPPEVRHPLIAFQARAPRLSHRIRRRTMDESFPLRISPHLALLRTINEGWEFS